MHGTVVFVVLICLSGVHFAPIKIGMEDFEKWLVPIVLDDRIIRIGDVELEITDLHFESRFLKVYNNVVDFIDGNLEPPRHFRLIFNRNVLKSISNGIFPLRYKAFLADAVEGNTVLYKMQCLIQRRINLDSSLDNSGTQRCWAKLDPNIYASNSDLQYYYETEDQVLGHRCRQFFATWYPDVSWDLLPAWEISLNPSHILQKRGQFQFGDKRLHGPHATARNFEETALQFYACTHEKIGLLQDVGTRLCYQRTLDGNMHSFLGDFLWKLPSEYTMLKKLFIKLAVDVAKASSEYLTTSRTTSKNEAPDLVQPSLLDAKTGLNVEGLSENEDQKIRVKKNSITIIESQDESIAYQRKAIIFVGVVIFMGCVILAVIITKIILCCKDFRSFYWSKPEPLEQDFKKIEENLKKGKSNLEFFKPRRPQKGRKTTHKMMSMSDMPLPIADDLKPLPDEKDPLIRTSFNKPSKPTTPKKKK